MSDASDEAHEEIVLAGESVVRRAQGEPTVGRTGGWGPVFVAATAVIAVVTLGAVLTSGDDQPDEDPPDPFDHLVELGGDDLPLPGSPVSASRYRTDSLGIAITFDLPSTGDWVMRQNLASGAMMFTSRGSGRTTSRAIVLQRVGSWVDREHVGDPWFRELGAIPAGDIDLWIEASGVIVDRARDDVVDGWPTTVRQVRLGPNRADAEGRPSATGILAATYSADLGQPFPLASMWRLQPGWSWRMWLVEFEGFEPVLVSAGSEGRDDPGGSWLDEVGRSLVGSIEFGEPRPLRPPDGG